MIICFTCDQSILNITKTASLFCVLCGIKERKKSKKEWVASEKRKMLGNVWQRVINGGRAECPKGKRGFYVVLEWFFAVKIMTMNDKLLFNRYFVRSFSRPNSKDRTELWFFWSSLSNLHKSATGIDFQAWKSLISCLIDKVVFYITMVRNLVWSRAVKYPNYTWMLGQSGWCICVSCLTL